MLCATLSTAPEKDHRTRHRQSRGSIMLTGLLVIGLLATALSARAAANEVTQWNETVLKVVDANGQNPIVMTRTLAMVHGAVHDALNAISHRYDAYYFEGPAEAGASPDAAVATAAHTILVGVARAPARRPRRRRPSPWRRRRIPRRCPASPIGRPGVAAWPSGVRRARRCSPSARMMGPTGMRRTRREPARASGGRIPIPFPDPPIANPDMARGYAPSILPGWGNVTPFTLLSSAQFWLPGPPPLASETYARDYNESRASGGRSARRARPTRRRSPASGSRGRRRGTASPAPWPAGGRSTSPTAPACSPS